MSAADAVRPRPGTTLAAVLAAAMVVSANAGKLPPALPALRAEFGLDLVAASLLVSFFQLAGMLLGLFGGMLADRFGPRRVMRRLPNFSRPCSNWRTVRTTLRRSAA